MGIFQVEGGRPSLVLLQGSSGRGTLVPVGVRSIFSGDFELFNGKVLNKITVGSKGGGEYGNYPSPPHCKFYRFSLDKIHSTSLLNNTDNHFFVMFLNYKKNFMPWVASF